MPWIVSSPWNFIKNVFSQLKMLRYKKGLKESRCTEWSDVWNLETNTCIIFFLEDSNLELVICDHICRRFIPVDCSVTHSKNCISRVQHDTIFSFNNYVCIFSHGDNNHSMNSETTIVFAHMFCFFYHYTLLCILCFLGLFFTSPTWYKFPFHAVINVSFSYLVLSHGVTLVIINFKSTIADIFFNQQDTIWLHFEHS